MRILDGTVSRAELATIAEDLFGDMVKAVADVAEGKLAIDAELHSDLEQLLLQNGSQQQNLWGINLYPDADVEDFIEFDSLINIRPRQNNRSRDVESAETRDAIRKIVDKYIVK